jgi:antitoxin component YwqK of YwqJK toxin-antitoxin module
MTLHFQPLTEQQMLEIRLVPEGTYNFEVAHAISTKSGKGNPMIKVSLKIWDNNGKERIVYDYLMTQSLSQEYKLGRFCLATGIHDKYNMGSIDDTDCINKRGKAHITIKKGDMKDDGTPYPDSNSVRDYYPNVPTEKVAELHSIIAKASEPEMSDDIPF